MTGHIDRELNRSINDVVDIYNDVFSRGFKGAQEGNLAAAVLTLAVVTHHQNGMNP